MVFFLYYHRSLKFPCGTENTKTGAFSTLFSRRFVMLLPSYAAKQLILWWSHVSPYQRYNSRETKSRASKEELFDLDDHQLPENTRPIATKSRPSGIDALFGPLTYRKQLMCELDCKTGYGFPIRNVRQCNWKKAIVWCCRSVENIGPMKEKYCQTATLTGRSLKPNTGG